MSTITTVLTGVFSKDGKSFDVVDTQYWDAPNGATNDYLFGLAHAKLFQHAEVRKEGFKMKHLNITNFEVKR